MKSVLMLVPLLVLLTVIPAICGAYIKLSALLLRQEGIIWKQGFVWGLLLMFCSLVVRAATVLSGHPTSLAPGIVLGFVINVLIGGWFFNSRGSNGQGGTLGWGGAVKLAGLAFVMLAFTGVALLFVSRILTTRAMP